MKKYLFVLIAFFLFGCATYSTSDLPGTSPNYDSVHIAKKDRKNITFSVSFEQEGRDIGDEIIVNKEDFTNKIRKALKESKLFNHINLVEPNKASDFHLAFKIVMQGEGPLGSNPSR